MVDLATIGTGVKILGGLKGIFGGGGSAATETRAVSRASIMGAADAADELGLHRLATMGGGGAGYSGPVGDNQAAGLDMIANALLDKSEGSKNDKLQRKQEELIDAQIAESRSRTLLNASNSRRSIYGPSTNPTGLTGGLEALDSGPGGSGRTTVTEPQRDMPARQRVTFGGHDAVGPNPEAFEVGLSELLAGAMIYGPQWVYSRMKNAQSNAIGKGGLYNRDYDYRSGQSRPGPNRGPY